MRTPSRYDLGTGMSHALRVVAVLLISLCMPIVNAQVSGPGDYFVLVDRLNVRLAPAPSARIVEQLDIGARVSVIQLAGDWARISDFYNGRRHNTEGMVAEWVATQFLSSQNSSISTPPASTEAVPEAPANQSMDSLTQALAGSDDFARHGEVFIATARRLLGSGTCKEKDFALADGWVRDGTEQPATYFVLCAGAAGSVTVFLNPVAGTVYH